MTEDPLQVDLQDDDLLAEVELTTALMAAANRSDSRLSLGEIDELLGVEARVRRSGLTFGIQAASA